MVLWLSSHSLFSLSKHNFVTRLNINNFFKFQLVTSQPLDLTVVGKHQNVRFVHIYLQNEHAHRPSNCIFQNAHFDIFREWSSLLRILNLTLAADLLSTPHLYVFRYAIDTTVF